MKRVLFIIGISLTTIFLVVIAEIGIRIRHDIKEHINIAREKYTNAATDEDALIAYLADTTNSPRDRNRIAVWTLGQIHSKKALPVLKELYRNDPKGKTCYGKHNFILCQLEIHTAIVAIENYYP